MYNVFYMFENRTFEPDTFQWPGHLLMQLGYLAVNVYSYVALGMRPEDAIALYPEGVWYPAVRAVSALFGIVAIVLAYFIGRFFGTRVGLISAGLFAFFPYFIEHSHYATVDMGLTTLILGVILVSMNYLKNPVLRNAAWMGVISGASITMKYPGALSTILIATVIILSSVKVKRWWQIVGHGLYSLFWFGLSAFLISPALFTNRHETIRSLFNESKTTHPGADGRNLFERLEFYASSYVQVTGILLLIPLVFGAITVLRKRELVSAPIFFGVFYWIALSFLALFWLRWGLPMFITPLLLSAIGIERMWSWVSTTHHRWARISLPVVGGLAAASLVFSAVAQSSLFLAKDTRVEALSYFKDRNITADTAYYEGYSPIDAGTLGKVFANFSWDGDALAPNDPSKEFVVLSSGTYGRYFADEKFAEERKFYEQLETQYEETYRIEPNLYFRSSLWEPINIIERARSIESIATGGVSGPIIRILDLNN